MTDEGRLARACHAYAQMEFIDCVRGKFQRPVRIDTAAPFSILPFSLWNGRNLAWQPLGSQFLTTQGHPQPGALTWLGVPCRFGEVIVVLLDERQHRTRPLRLVAKLPQGPVSRTMEGVILAGYNFLTDNSITLTLHPGSPTTAGALTDVVGFLTVP